MRKIISLLIIASFLVGGISALAQTEENTKVGIEPDSVFYFLEQWREQIQLFFTFNLEKKAEQYLKLSEERLAEYQRMLEKGKDEIAAKVLAKYENQLGHALEVAKKFQEKEGNFLKDKVKETSDNVAKHIEILQNNLSKAKESAKKGFQNAIESAQKVMERFNNPNEQENIQGGNGQVIGGDKDINGCLGAAGYSWCESKGKCLRVFEEWCSDQSEGLIDEIEKVSGVEFQKQDGQEFSWNVRANNQVKQQLINGEHYKAENITPEQYQKIEKYFSDNFQLNIENVADGVTGGLRGYTKGYMACELSYEFTNVAKKQGEPSIPDTSKRETEIKCGFFNNNLSD